MVCGIPHAAFFFSTSRQRLVRERLGFSLHLPVRERGAIRCGKCLHMPCARRYHKHEQNSSVDCGNLFPPPQDLTRQPAPLRALAEQHPVRRFRPSASAANGHCLMSSPVLRILSGYRIKIGEEERAKHSAADASKHRCPIMMEARFHISTLALSIRHWYVPHEPFLGHLSVTGGREQISLPNFNRLDLAACLRQSVPRIPHSSPNRAPYPHARNPFNVCTDPRHSRRSIPPPPPSIAMPLLCFGAHCCQTCCNGRSLAECTLNIITARRPSPERVIIGIPPPRGPAGDTTRIRALAHVGIQHLIRRFVVLTLQIRLARDEQQRVHLWILIPTRQFVLITHAEDHQVTGERRLTPLGSLRRGRPGQYPYSGAR